MAILIKHCCSMAFAISTAMKSLEDEHVLADIKTNWKEEDKSPTQQNFLPRTLKIVFAKDYNVTTNPKLFTTTAGAHQQEGETVLNLDQCDVNIFKLFIISVAMIVQSRLFAVSNPGYIVNYILWKVNGFHKICTTGSNFLWISLSSNKWWRKCCITFNNLSLIACRLFGNKTSLVCLDGVGLSLLTAL